MATNIDPKTLFSTPNQGVTSFSLWNIRYNDHLAILTGLDLSPWQDQEG